MIKINFRINSQSDVQKTLNVIKISKFKQHNRFATLNNDGNDESCKISDDDVESIHNNGKNTHTSTIKICYS